MLANIFVKRDLALIFGYRQEALLAALDVPRGPAEMAFGSVNRHASQDRLVGIYFFARGRVDPRGRP